MAGNGYLQRRVSGAVKPEKQYEEKSIEPTPKPIETKQKQNNKKVFANQQKSIKIPQETYVELNVLKNMQRLKFDYEAIQFIVSQYYNTLSTEEKKRFNVLKDNL